MKTLILIGLCAMVMALAGCGGCGKPPAETPAADTAMAEPPAAVSVEPVDLNEAAAEAGLDTRAQELLAGAEQPVPDYGAVTRENYRQKLSSLEGELANEEKNQ